MIGFAEQVERLRVRQRFAARMHTRRDILAPSASDARLLPALLDQLDPVLDYAVEPDRDSRCPLPYGIRTVRYALSPAVQDTIGADGRAGGMLVRRMPVTLDDTAAFVAESCPVEEADWGELRRLIYVDPEGFAALIHPLRATHEPLFRLILSREYRLALSRYRFIADVPANTLGYTGRLIDLCIAFGEMERCDTLGTGLAMRQVDVRSVRRTLLDQGRLIAAIRDRTPEGDYLLGLLTNPALLPRPDRSERPWYGPWASPDPFAYDPVADFADERRYAAFVDDVLALPMFSANAKRPINANLATYWGADLAQLAEITFIAAGDTVRMHRGGAVDHDMTSIGKGVREEAIRVLADGFRARHDAAFCKALADRRASKAAELVAADEAERSRLDDAPATPIDVRLTNVGASRIQQNRDRAALIAPQAGMPGHASAIDGAMWLQPRADRALWQTLCVAPPSRAWLDQKGIPAAAKRAFEAIRQVRAAAPQLFHRRAPGDARLLADLATAVGWLSGQPKFTARVRELVQHAPELRLKGWIAPRIGARWGGGGNPDGRSNKGTRISHKDDVVRL